MLLNVHQRWDKISILTLTIVSFGLKVPHREVLFFGCLACQVVFERKENDLDKAGPEPK